MSTSAKSAYVTAAESTHMAAATEAAAVATSTTSATCLGRGRDQAGSNKSCCHDRYQSFHVSLPFTGETPGHAPCPQQAMSASRIPM
jgi:hypothetical protein